MAHTAVSNMNVLLKLTKMALEISQNNNNTANDYRYMKDQITAMINHVLTTTLLKLQYRAQLLKVEALVYKPVAICTYT